MPVDCEFKLGSGDVEVGVVELSEPKRVSGRVVTEHGLPVVGANVSIGRREGQPRVCSPPSASVETDATGSYTLTNVPRGRYMGAAVVPGYPPTFVTLTIGPADPAVVEALPIQMAH